MISSDLQPSKYRNGSAASSPEYRFGSNCSSDLRRHGIYYSRYVSSNVRLQSQFVAVATHGIQSIGFPISVLLNIPSIFDVGIMPTASHSDIPSACRRQTEGMARSSRGNLKDDDGQSTVYHIQRTASWCGSEEPKVHRRARTGVSPKQTRSVGSHHLR